MAAYMLKEARTVVHMCFSLANTAITETAPVSYLQSLGKLIDRAHMAKASGAMAAAASAC
jgi:hypothetical protein